MDGNSIHPIEIFIFKIIKCYETVTYILFIWEVIILINNPNPGHKIFIVLGPVEAYEHCWIFGDEFISRSYEQYFNARKCTDYNSYSKAHFNIMPFCNNFTCENPSILARISSLLQNAVSQTLPTRKIKPLLKIIVMVLDDDLIKILDTNASARSFSRCLNFIMTEYDRCVASFKENLPAKNVKVPGYPYFLWIQLPLHEYFENNTAREHFNRCLDELVKLHSNVYTLALKKVWDPKDENLYLKTQRFTSEGLRAYWEAVDKTIRYF